MIEPVGPSLAERTNAVHYQIGLDMRDVNRRLIELERCCAEHQQPGAKPPTPPINYQPTGAGTSTLPNNISIIDTRQLESRLKRDIKLIPTGEFSLMDMALGPDGDLLAEPGLETAVLMSLFSDKRHNHQRGYWADELIERKTGSLLWLLVREKTTGTEHKEGNVLLRAEDYCKQALKWLLDKGEATGITVSAQWGENRTTDRLILQIIIQLPTGSRFTGL